jgi:ABC-type multidrug transport system fused ATPase/permease subunit
MKDAVERLPSKLEEVVTGSSRFSRGQKQLLALARALLRRKLNSLIRPESDLYRCRTHCGMFG